MLVTCVMLINKTSICFTHLWYKKLEIILPIQYSYAFNAWFSQKGNTYLTNLHLEGAGLFNCA